MRPYRKKIITWLAAAFLGIILPLGLVSQADAFPLFGGLIKRLLLTFGGTVHDQARENLQIAVLAEEGVKLALLEGTEEALGDVLVEVERWDSLRVVWLDEYERQLTGAPDFAYETAPVQQQRAEASLSGRDAALLAFMEDRDYTEARWTATDTHFTRTQGDALTTTQEATHAALGAQTGALTLMESQQRAFDVDADEIARLRGRIDSLVYEQQMRDMKAQGLLLQVKHLQQLRYQIVTETSRRAAAYGDDLNSEARRRALYDRLLQPALSATTR